MNTEAGAAESVAARVNERAAARRDLQLHAEDPEVLGGRAELLANFFGAEWGNFRENANDGDPPG